MKKVSLILATLLFGFHSYSQIKEEQPKASEYPADWISVRTTDGLMGFIDSKGEEIVAPVYQMIYPFGEFKDDWARVENENGLTGFIDLNGAEIVMPKYDYIEKFGMYKKEWAMVSLDGLYGFITLEGEEIVAPHYAEIELMPNK